MELLGLPIGGRRAGEVRGVLWPKRKGWPKCTVNNEETMAEVYWYGLYHMYIENTLWQKKNLLSILFTVPEWTS
jgi:hypothetical protein